MKKKDRQFRILAAEARIGEIRTRMPFRYGNACLTVSPVLLMRVTIESTEGTRSSGLASDCLPPRWFDKDPSKPYRQNVQDQLEAFGTARDVYLSVGEEARSAMGHWEAAFPQVQSACSRAGLNSLTASFASSFFERAVLDALCRLHNLSLFDGLRQDLFGFESSPYLPRSR